jgi:subtilisin family serine protease
MPPRDEGSFPTSLSHPALGPSALEPSRLAVRWRQGAAVDARESLLSDLGLARLETGAERPATAVNGTDGLWWVERIGGRPIARTLLGRLEQSDLVEWISPAYRSEGAAEEGDAALYAVNPTRLYVRDDAFAASGGAEALPSGVALDSARTTRLPGLTVVQIDDVSAAEGRTALHFAEQMAGRLSAEADVDPARAVRFENIPYLSPRCCGCRPPTTEFVPDDPMFADQWGLQRIEVPRAWEIVRGDPSITVAVIDEGVQLNHPDLDVHPQSWNASTDTPDGSPTDNHGTACAGIVAARLDNGQGPAGVAGGARVMAIATATWADVDIAEGLYFAADNGARVVSMSFGVYPSYGWDFDLIRDALQYAHDKGLVLVAASGNEDGPVARFPGSDDRTLCVGGSNRSDERRRIGDSSPEQWWGASYGPDLDVVAPSLEIPTTDRLGGDGYDAGDYFAMFNGTSAATPHVAGIAALMLSLRPSLSNVDVRAIIERTCDKISPNLYAYANVAGRSGGTWNDEVGYGRVNAERALLAACAGGDDGAAQRCRGCGGECAEETPEECRGPAPLPWLDPHRCMYFYEARVFDADRIDDRRRLQLRVTYQHCLRLLGRHQGGLLYTTTLLPGETVELYEYDRYRRVRSDQERMSVHSSFRQTMSALSQTRRSASSSAYADTLTEVRTSADTSVSAGGGLAGFFGAPSVTGEFSVAVETTIASGASVRTASEQFSQNAVTSAQSTDAERSVVISRFEESEHASTTRRKLHNANDCYAVTYYVRSVNEVYESSTRVESVEWRFDDDPWRSLADTDGQPERVRKALKDAARELPRPGDVARDGREITLPTDGTLYEPELAHCSSCEPMREEAMRIQLEAERLRARRACLEAELLALELERRRGAIAGDSAIELKLGRWPLELPAGTPEPSHD